MINALNNERYTCIHVLHGYLESVSQGQDEAKSCLRKLLSRDSVLKLQFSPQLLLLFTQKREKRGQGVILEERDQAGREEENDSLGFSTYLSTVTLEDWK